MADTSIITGYLNIFANSMPNSAMLSPRQFVLWFQTVTTKAKNQLITRKKKG